MVQTLVSLSTTPSSSHDILRYRDKSFQISQMNLHHSFLKLELVGGAYSGHNLGFLMAVKQNLGVKALWNLKKVLERCQLEVLELVLLGHRSHMDSIRQ